MHTIKVGSGIEKKPKTAPKKTKEKHARERRKAKRDKEEESGRALLPILNRIAQLRVCLKPFRPTTAHD